MRDATREIERIARLSYGRLVASLSFRVGSIARAEDALSEALMRALDVWERQGVPKNPEGWLLRTARNKAVDDRRSEARAETYRTEIEMLLESHIEDGQTGIEDPRIRLMFACAHPAIEPRIRAPLMLQTVLGLDSRRIASVYLMSPGTLGQRLTRAKAKIEQSGIPLTLPSEHKEYEARLDDILTAIYAAYAVGANGFGSGDAKATNLASEALWLISTVCAALPSAAEAHGLFALILFTESRRNARFDAVSNTFIPLQQQDVNLWNSEMIRDAEQALRNAQSNLSLGRFQLEASIQAVHAARQTSGYSDWAALQTLYRGLVKISPTVGALTSQAAAEAETGGPEVGLQFLDRIDPQLRETYQPWHATRAHLLSKQGQTEAALSSFDSAIGLSNDPSERAYLMAEKAKLPRS